MGTLTLLWIALLSTAPAFATGAAPRYVYALDCPGSARPITGLRHDWAQTGDPIPERYVSLVDEMIFHSNRGLERDWMFARFWLNRSSSKSDAEILEKMRTITDWRPGYYIPTEGLNLPDIIDGCRVIPILAQIPADQKSPKVFYGAADAFNALSAIDQLIVLIASMGESTDVMRFLLGERFEQLTVRDRVELQKISGDFRFKLWGGEFSTEDCLFYENGNPRTCYPLGDWRTGRGVWMFFHENGVISSYVLNQPFAVRTDLRVMNVKVPCEGLVKYGPDAKLRACKDRLFRPDLTPSYGPYETNTLRRGFRAHLKGPAILNEQGIALGGTDNHSFFESGDFTRYDPVDGGFIEVFPDGFFRSATVTYVQGGKTVSAFLELNADGSLKRKIDNAASEVVMFANPETAEKAISLTEKPAEILEWQTMVNDDGCAEPRVLNGSLILAPECSAVVKVLRKK